MIWESTVAEDRWSIVVYFTSIGGLFLLSAETIKPLRFGACISRKHLVNYTDVRLATGVEIG